MRRSQGRFLWAGTGSWGRIHRRAASIAPSIALIALAAPALSAEPPPPPPAAQAKDASSRAAQDDKAQRIKRAHDLADESADLYERGEYRAAIAKLEAATELDPQGADLAYNLGLIHERLGELDIAEKYYRRDLELEADPKLRERAQGILKRLEGAKKQMPVKAATPAPLPPAPDRPPPPKRVGAGVIVSSSIAGAALASAVGFGIGALVKSPGMSAATRPGYGVGDIEAQAKRAHELAIVSDISWIGFAVASSAAILFYVTAPRSSPAASQNPRAGSRVEIDVGAGRASMRVVF